MKILTILSLALCCTASQAQGEQFPELPEFINKMEQEHAFDAQALETLFTSVKVKESILKAISRPAEKSKAWYDYRKIFLGQRRINGGVDFWREHAADLARAEAEYGVPAEIIVAILGVETRYGGNVGGYRVIDALSTLAFQYPKRSKFFRSELEHFLLLAREEGKPPLLPVGSYAGAMGLAQFMPSSYRHYAIDFDGDSKRDIWENPTDAIGSIANYLAEHGWVRGQSIVHKSAAASGSLTAVLEAGLKPSLNRGQVAAAGLSLTNLPHGEDKLSVIELENTQGPEFWIARQNFYAITRYNHSAMYAMAVTQLGDEIRQKYQK
jgi:membrane-bound lytic murein transglycosylase B